MAEKDKILEEWIMVEHLSEGDISVKDKSILTLDHLQGQDFYSMFTISNVISYDGLMVQGLKKKGKRKSAVLKSLQLWYTFLIAKIREIRVQKVRCSYAATTGKNIYNRRYLCIAGRNESRTD